MADVLVPTSKVKTNICFDIWRPSRHGSISTFSAQISCRRFMQHTFSSRQFSPKSETALGPIAHWEKVDLLRWNSWAWGCWASRGGRSNDQAWLYDPGKFGGLPPPSPRLPTLCARVYSIGKYNAQPKSVWKYTHLANDHHKPYTARISFSSKLASIVFFRPQKLFAFSKDIFFGTILWDSSERHKISNRTDSFILLKVFAAVWRLQKDYKVWNNNWGSQTILYCLTLKII